MHDRLPAHMLVRAYICMYLDVMREEHHIRHSVFLRRSGHTYSATENGSTHTLLTFRLALDFILHDTLKACCMLVYISEANKEYRITKIFIHISLKIILILHIFEILFLIQKIS